MSLEMLNGCRDIRQDWTGSFFLRKLLQVPDHFLLYSYRHLKIFFAFFREISTKFRIYSFATLNNRASKHRRRKKYREMINLRVGFPRFIVEFLLQVPRINGMKYHIKFFYCVACCFERTGDNFRSRWSIRIVNRSGMELQDSDNCDAIKWKLNKERWMALNR